MDYRHARARRRRRRPRAVLRGRARRRRRLPDRVGEQREREALLEAGAVACLTKDEGLDEIVAAIQRAAGRRTA